MLTMVAVTISVLWTLGLYSLMGFSYNVLSSMIVPLIVVLAIADDVHMMQHWDEERRLGDNEHAFKATVAHLAAPLLGASATTALGMLSLATSNVVAVRAFGIGSGRGDHDRFRDFVGAGSHTPHLGEAGDGSSSARAYLIRPLQRIARLSCQHPGRVLLASVLVGTVAAVGMLWLRVDTNHINFFRRSHPFSQSAAVIDRSLAGVYSFQIMLEGPSDSLKTPDALQRIDRLEDALRAFPHVRKVTSVADYVKRINQELNDGRTEMNVIPADRNTIAQELFVFALGNEGRQELERVVANDFSRAQITIKLRVDEFGRRPPPGRRSRQAGESHLRRNADFSGDDRLGQVVQHPRSLSRDVAVEQLCHRVRDRLRGHLRCLSVGTVRRADHRAERPARCSPCSASWAISTSR